MFPYMTSPPPTLALRADNRPAPRPAGAPSGPTTPVGRPGAYGAHGGPFPAPREPEGRR
jgi:hypothetical protein